MSAKATSILIGALTYVLLGTLASVMPGAGGPLSAVLGCLTILVSAVVAVWHYTSTNELTITGGEGAGIGAIAGLIGAIVAGIVGYILISMGVVPDPTELAIQQLRERGMSADEIEQAMAFSEAFSSPIVTLLIGAVFGAIGGAIGGALGAALFKKGGPEPTVDSGF